MGFDNGSTALRNSISPNRSKSLTRRTQDNIMIRQSHQNLYEHTQSKQALASGLVSDASLNYVETKRTGRTGPKTVSL